MDDALATDAAKLTAGELARYETMTAYRNDIDGLRAIAVSSVVLFHAGIPGLPGGFTGVDIFFVISGYLIGGQIAQELAQRRFSLQSFYTRRARRILPALFGMLFCFFVVGLLIMNPLELRELGKEAVPTATGGSNILFYLGSGYFDPAADLKPLLMTWSLGLEEQFYVVFPFVLMLLMKVPRVSTAVALMVITAVSFAASLVLVRDNPQAAFFLLPARSWELGIGCWIALIERRRLAGLAMHQMTTNLLAAVGLVLIGISIALYQPTFVFPGVFALLPVFGSSLLLASPSSAINQRVLGSVPMSRIGQLSYSWYIWHWPLLYLNRILAQGQSGIAPVWIVIVSLASGALSWKFIEQSFRRRVVSGLTALLRYAVSACVIVLIAFALYLKSGFPEHYGPVVAAFTRQARETQADVCLARAGVERPYAVETCVPPLSAPTTQRFLLIGDSHGSSISKGFAQVAALNGLGFGQMSKSSCSPLWGFANIDPSSPAATAECLAYQKAAYGYVASHQEVTDVVIAGRWSEARMLTRDAGSAANVPLGFALESTVTRLEALGRRVVLVQDVPNFAFDPYMRVIAGLIPVRRFFSELIGSAPVGGSIAAKTEVLPDYARATLMDVARHHPSIILIDPTEQLCDSQGCRYRDRQSIYYFDFQHLTSAGALVAIAPFKF